MSKEPSKLKSSSIIVLKAIIEEVLESIPVYGKGFKIANKIKDKLEKEQFLRRDELIALLHTPQSDVVTLVDSLFDSPKGKEQTAKLSVQEKKTLRDQLINIPSEIDLILSELERNEQFLQEELRIKKATEISETRLLLKKSLQTKNLYESKSLAGKILKLKPGDEEAIKALKWLEKRVGGGIGDDFLRGAIATFLIGGMMIAAISEGKRHTDIYVVMILGITLIGGFIGLIRGIIKRSPRK